jgi:predicted Fe-S protein YdhL (DUF1289 family)
MKHPILTACLIALTAITGYAAFGGPMRHALTPEERLMYMQEQRGPNWHTLSLEQRCARQQQLRSSWASMKPADLQHLKQQLDAKWNALPAAQKEQLRQRIQHRIARRQQRRMAASAPGQNRAARGDRGRRCAGATGAPL